MMAEVHTVSDRPVARAPERERRRRVREVRRERALARATTVVDPATLPDPLLRPSSESRGSAAAWALTGALVVHALILITALVAPGDDDRARHDYVEPVHVEVVEPPAPAPLELPPPVTPPPVAPIEAPRPPPPVKKPVEAKTATPPPDPVDVPPTPTVEPPKEPPRRVVGLSLESTTTGAADDAFATGNTRMGETSTVAEDPTKVAPLAHTYTEPRRTSVYIPPYPPSLRGKGVRGEVGLHVAIDATGQVTGVTVTRPSAYDEFNTAAVDAAKRCTYEPARLDGTPVARAIDITVQFQPRD